MNKKSFLWLVPFLLLVSCKNNQKDSSSSSIVSSTTSTNVNETIALDELASLLTNDFYTKEVTNSNKVVFNETDTRGDTVYKQSETLDIYSDETSFATGNVSAEYASSDKVEDSYKKVVTTRTYSSQKVIYFVTDYEYGNKRATWADNATRLPVVSSGDSSQDGVNYLLESSVAGQISKQVSLISYNFIATYLLNNPDVQTALPSVEVVSENTEKIYRLENYSYTYAEDDDTDVTVIIEFEIKTDNNGLISSTLRYSTEQKRVDEEVYVMDLISNYVVSYGNRVESTTNTDIIDPTEYFLETVDEVKAYIYDNGEKVYVNINNLPIDRYINFEASVYTPSKAVDLQMYPVDSSNVNVIKPSSDVFETLNSGEATLTIESATGILKEVSVRVNIPEISRFIYTDVSSDIEIVMDSETTTRYIYTNTTYNRISLSVRPEGALLGDVEIIISDENVLQIEIVNQTSKMLELEYTVLGNNDSHKVDVTFQSKTNSDVKTTITYNIKDRLSDEEIIEKFMANTYRWDNIYTIGQYAIMSFTSETQGHIEYFDGEEKLGESNFTFTFNGTTFTPVMEDGALFGYNGGNMTLDGNQIVMRVDDTLYVHYYNIVSA